MEDLNVKFLRWLSRTSTDYIKQRHTVAGANARIKCRFAVPADWLVRTEPVGTKASSIRHDSVAQIASIVRRAQIPNAELVSEPEAAAAFIMNQNSRDIQKYDTNAVPDHLRKVAHLHFPMNHEMSLTEDRNLIHSLLLMWEEGLPSGFSSLRVGYGLTIA